MEAQVNHIDTSGFYGPHVTNQIIKQALHPYPDGLVIVTKVGARRGTDKPWLHALRENLEAATLQLPLETEIADLDLIERAPGSDHDSDSVIFGNLNRL